MAIRSVRAVGDDQKWKAAVEQEVKDLRDVMERILTRLETLERRVNN